MEEFSIKIERKCQDKVFWQEYVLEFVSGRSIFSWLKQIQEELDPTLAFECSCNAGQCGACAICADDKPILSCKERVKCAQPLTIRPLGNLPILKDLVIDWRRVDNKMREHTPWLFEDYTPLSSTYTMDEYTTQLDKELADCISCGICAAACPALRQSGFDYPFVFVKGHRLVIDSNVPRELKDKVRKDLQDKAQQCISCHICDRNCPKGVRPSRSISVLRS